MISREQWLRSKSKAHHITLSFIGLSGGQAFKNGRLIPAYYAIKKCFAKMSDEELNVLYEYATNLHTVKEMSITDFINGAKNYNVSKHYADTANTKEYTDYQRLLEEM